MNDTLQLLNELLEHDPGSKIFFPLAKVYRKQGDADRAIEIVRKGLGFHPDYLEARLLLIELLHDTGDGAEAEKIATEIQTKFTEYIRFWTFLRLTYAKTGRTDLQLAAFLFEQDAKKQSVDFASFVQGGVSHCLGIVKQAGAVVHEPMDDLDAEEVTQLCINSGIKTKTMAKLLVAQDEYEQAVQIYNELIDACQDPLEKKELISLRTHIQHKAGILNTSEPQHNEKLYTMLTSLASRLESKSNSA